MSDRESGAAGGGRSRGAAAPAGGGVPATGAPDPIVGARLSHFEVLERIGSGGMGVVYRARDLRLPREVAIKMLPPGMLADPEVRARFMREAETLARLSHPGIATLFEYGRAGDLDFIVMELVPGDTLEERLAAGPLAEPEILALGGRIAEALAAAHEQQVVHRDLKPGNVILTPRGGVKVLDFGVARFVGGGSTSQTMTGAAGPPGTIAYMAPEQLLERVVDGRADLWALGIVLYRMATGRLPFAEGPPLAVVNRILNETPRPPRALRPEISPGLEALILRCLEKDAARRPASAVEVVAALEALREAGAAAAAGAPPALRSLVVLPLENLSGDPGQEYFADGMTDTLITNLARIGALRVISRTSAMRFKGVRRPLPEIARELGVEAVVEGTVLRDGDRVRITAQLVDAAADRTLWAFSVEREVRDVLALQAEVAGTVAAEIQVLLTPEERERLERARPVDPRVLELVLFGRFLWNKRTPAEIERAIEHFRAALEVDPGSAAAWSGLADAWNVLGAFRVKPPSEAFPKARVAAERALALDAGLAEAHASLAFALKHEWDFVASERSFRRAIELNPGYVTAHMWYAELLEVEGRFDEALTHAKRGSALDPLSPLVGSAEANVHYFMRHYDAALAGLDRQAALHPEFAIVRLDRGRTLEELGRLDEARAEFETGTRLAGTDPAESAPLAHLYALAGERDRALAVVERLVAASARRHVSPYAIATVFAGLRDVERGIEWLERAVAGRDAMSSYLRIHPRLDPLRGDPRFAALERRVGIPG